MLESLVVDKNIAIYLCIVKVVTLCTTIRKIAKTTLQ